MDRLDTASAPGAAIALQSVSGMAGVGKSLLAWSAAERLADRYPSGVLHVDLRANTPGQDPVSPRAAPAQLLRALGAPAQGASDDLDALTAQWRGAMRGRRMVVVLDNASGPEQVRPLLPGDSPSAVLITSRRRLSGLPGVRHVVLDVLSMPEATALFQRMIDDDRADDPNEVAEIVSLCGALPLAVEIAASRLSSRPSWTLSYLITRLSREHALLDELHDTDRDIEVAFRVSYDTLTAQERTVFRLLSLHTGPDFGPYSAAAVTGLPLNRVERAIDALVDTHLLQAPAPERYRFHDLLGEFAHNLQAPEDTPADREAALRRLLDFYIAAADAADRLIHPERPRLDIPAEPAPHAGIPPWADRSEAEQWLYAEHIGLVKAAHWARAHGDPGRAALLGHVLAGFLANGLGILHWNVGRFEEALGVQREVLALREREGDRLNSARALNNLGLSLLYLGRHPMAHIFLGEALSELRAIGDRPFQFRVLNNIGDLYVREGNHRAAREAVDKARAIELENAPRAFLAVLDITHATTLDLPGELDEALGRLRGALALSRELNDVRDQVICLNEIGTAFRRSGRAREAPAPHTEALDLARGIGATVDTVQAMIGLGAAESALRMPEGRDRLTTALTLARQLHLPVESAEADELLQLHY